MDSNKAARKKPNQLMKTVLTICFMTFVMIFAMGVYSKPLISKMEPAVNKFIEDVNARHTSVQYINGMEITLPAKNSHSGSGSGGMQ